MSTRAETLDPADAPAARVEARPAISQILSELPFGWRAPLPADPTPNDEVAAYCADAETFARARQVAEAKLLRRRLRELESAR